LWQYAVQGQVYAQPLAVSSVSDVANCGTCDVVFVATEQDMLYAFNAASNQQLWSMNLASLSVPGGMYLNCGCSPGVIYPDYGVTGTPVIDTSSNTLFVVSDVQPPGNLRRPPCFICTPSTSPKVLRRRPRSRLWDR
ncbi:MAG: hypothetical protein WAL32_04320, partial [Terriglobales bacterium]